MKDSFPGSMMENGPYKSTQPPLLPLYQVLGTRYLAPDARNLAPATQYLVLGAVYQVPVPGPWYQVPVPEPGTRYEVSGTRYLVPGTYQILGACVH